MAKKLPDGVGTGKSPPPSNTTEHSSFNELPCNPSNRGPETSHPGKGNSSGDVGTAPPLRPKQKGEYA